MAFPGGLTPEHYEHFSRIISDHEKAVVAMGVLESEIAPKSWQEWDSVQNLLFETFGFDDSEWLLSLIENNGFEPIAAVLKQHLVEYRQNYQPSRIKMVVFETPCWNMKRRVLTYGGNSWRFRDDAEVILTLLNELDKNQWQPICLSDPHDQGKPGKTYIDPIQVRDAAKALRRRTKPQFNWHAGDDGTFGCLMP